MGRMISWLILVGIFLASGYGLNVIRVAIMDKLADPSLNVGWRLLAGLLLLAFGIYYLGGFIYYRLQKRGKLSKPDWKK